MTYVMSDIHGNYEKFKEMLAKIRFGERDVLYVLGDLCGGDEPIELILDISMRYNVLPVLGESDYRALPLLTSLDAVLRGQSADPETMARIAEWISEDGRSTVEGFRALDEDMREGVLDYLSDMALYEETQIGSQKYLLLHAGIADFDADTPLEDYMPEDFISESLDSKREYYPDVITVAGHAPTESGKIERTDYAILVDCGAEYGGTLGCIRLEDGEEFYV